jgi:hypothetical protein
VIVGALPTKTGAGLSTTASVAQEDKPIHISEDDAVARFLKEINQLLADMDKKPLDVVL